MLTDALRQTAQNNMRHFYAQWLSRLGYPLIETELTKTVDTKQLENNSWCLSAFGKAVILGPLVDNSLQTRIFQTDQVIFSTIEEPAQEHPFGVLFLFRLWREIHANRLH